MLICSVEFGSWTPLLLMVNACVVAEIAIDVCGSREGRAIEIVESAVYVGASGLQSGLEDVK